MDLISTLNSYGSKKEPFFFIISYDQQQWDVCNLDTCNENIKFKLDSDMDVKTKKDISFTPVSKDIYEDKFTKVMQNITDGNSYLLNLTQASIIDQKIDLEEIYKLANSKYKIYYKDKFVSFSPEKFIQINDEKIYTYPMKGTIDASILNAREKILADPKEIAEHTMVVDLLRNDLNIVAKDVKVEQFRYTDTISAGNKELIQVSSKISGKLDENWNEKLGNIITSLLPAGSITGTPKKKTVEIINEVENYDRGYFTGICGVYDGKSLDSFVLIRFIEKLLDGSFVYKSGGGITSDSDMDSEYKEMCDKVYIP